MAFEGSVDNASGLWKFRGMGDAKKLKQSGPADVGSTGLVQLGGPTGGDASRAKHRLDLNVPAVIKVAEFLEEADILIYWPSAKFFTAVPSIEDLLPLGSLPEFWFGEPDDPKVRIYRTGEELLKTWEKNPALMTEHLRVFLAHYLQSAFTIAKAGGVVVLVVPANFDAWPVHVRKAAFGWAFPRINILNENNTKVSTPDLGGNANHSIPFANALRQHPKWISTWPMTCGLDMNEADLLPDEERSIDSEGSLHACELTPWPEMKGDIHYFATVINRFERAKAMAFSYGKGGFLLIPEPASFDTMLADLLRTESSAKLRIPFTRDKDKGGLPAWQVEYKSTTFTMRPAAFLILLAHVVAAKLGQDGINPLNPKIGATSLDTLGVMKKRKSSTTSKVAQQVHEAFKSAGTFDRIIVPVGSSTGASHSRKYGLALSADDVVLEPPRNVDLPEPVKALLALLPRTT